MNSMRRFPVRVVSVVALALALSVLPAMAAQASPWAVSPLQGGWFVKAELLLARAWARWAPVVAQEAPEAVAPRGRSLLKEGAVADPNG